MYILKLQNETGAISACWLHLHGNEVKKEEIMYVKEKPVRVEGLVWGVGINHLPSMVERRE